MTPYDIGTADWPPFRQTGGKPVADTADIAGGDNAQTVAAGQLRSFIERVERLEEEKKTIADDIREVYAEMEGTGFETKAVRALVRARKKDRAELLEEMAILQLYAAALGMEGVFG